MMNMDAQPIFIAPEAMNISREEAELLVGFNLADALLTLMENVRRKGSSVAIAALHDGYRNTLVASINGSPWKCVG
jgi:hypothetical protein